MRHISAQRDFDPMTQSNQAEGREGSSLCVPCAACRMRLVESSYLLYGARIPPHLCPPLLCLVQVIGWVRWRLHC